MNPPNPTPASRARPRPSGDPPAPSGREISQTPPSARPKPANWSGEGSPCESAAKQTGSAAATTAVTGAAIPIRPPARAPYRAALPTAPQNPAMTPHPRADGGGNGDQESTS